MQSKKNKGQSLMFTEDQVNFHETYNFMVVKYFIY